MRLWLSGFTFGFWLCLIAALPAQTAPKRIMSTSLCADQLLIELADRDQIVSLSPLATNGELSFYADRARAYPQNHGNAEDMVRLSADLILVSGYNSFYGRALIEARGIPFEIVRPWRGLEDGEAQIRHIAAIVGHPERGEELIRRIDAALAQADGAAAHKRSVLILERRGYVVGDPSLLHEVATKAGLVDAAASLGIKHQGFISLEKLVRQHPDYLMMSHAGLGAQDQGEALLVHPALLELYPAARRLIVPNKLSICDGPATPALINQIAAEARAKVR